MPAPRDRPLRTAREYVPRAELLYDHWDGVPPGPDTAPCLNELAARAAENARPPGCPLCSGPDGYGRAHDPSCLLA